MSRRRTQLLILLALAVAGVLLWNKVRIVFWVRLAWWQLGLLFLAVALVAFLALDWLADRLRGPDTG